MKFGVHGAANVASSVERSIRAEQLGYDMVSFGDSPMILSDVYVTMALVAQATKKVTIGTGVAVAGTRMAPVVAAALATVNQIAPGRVFVGLGTGATSYKLIGHNSPVKLAQFREFALAVQGLIAGEEVEFAFNGQVKPIRFLNPEGGYVNTENHIPMYFAATGPKIQELAGEIADGVFDGWVGTDIDTLKERLRAGAERSGRKPDELVIFNGQPNIVLLEKGEDLTSERAIEQAGFGAALVLHFIYDTIGRVPAENAPPLVADFWDD